MNDRVAKTTRKYGIKMPRTIDEAFKVDAANGNTIWRDTVDKEMENLKVAFDILLDGIELPPC